MQDRFPNAGRATIIGESWRDSIFQPASRSGTLSARLDKRPSHACVIFLQDIPPGRHTVISKHGVLPCSGISASTGLGVSRRHFEAAHLCSRSISIQYLRDIVSSYSLLDCSLPVSVFRESLPEAKCGEASEQAAPSRRRRLGSERLKAPEARSPRFLR